MKCRYLYVGGEKILIPNCMGVAISQDIEDCVCGNTRDKQTVTEAEIIAVAKQTSMIYKEMEIGFVATFGIEELIRFVNIIRTK